MCKPSEICEDCAEYGSDFCGTCIEEMKQLKLTQEKQNANVHDEERGDWRSAGDGSDIVRA